MSKAVRYFSRTGNTKTIAEAIADGAGVSAVSITDEPDLKTHVDGYVVESAVKTYKKLGTDGE